MHASISRRHFVRAGFAAAGAAAVSEVFSTLAFAQPAPGEEVVPFLDPQPANPKRPMLVWQDLRDWITPEEEFFRIGHYNTPKVSADEWKLRVEGRVEKPVDLTLEQLKARPRREITATLECSGNGANPGFMGAIGNAKWAGTPLAELLKEAAVQPEAVEIAFWGADSGKEKIREHEYEQNFARALSVAEATRGDVLLAWEMNGKPLTADHGFPVRLIVPGWYGIAWVKWLTRIEVRERPLMNRFMARDYVTVRGEKHGDVVEWKESSVGPMNVKSLVGRVTRRADGTLRVTGAAWGHDAVAKVELKMDDGPWVAAELQPGEAGADHAWTFWSCELKNPAPGEHTLVCRATDSRGRVQPAAEDDAIKLKKTYWEANQQYPRRIKL